MNQDFVPYQQVRQANGLGVAAFICSLVGLFTGGILSPIGLILSLVALGRQPRGMAVAGLILGLLGTCGGIVLVIVILAFGLAVALAAVGIFAFTQSERIELTADMAKIAVAAEEFKRDNRDVAPAGVEVLNLEPSTLNDPWGHPYRYILVAEEPGYDVISDGQDGKAGTPDDVSLGKLDRYWEGAMDDFERQMKEMDARQRRRQSGDSPPATTNIDRPPFDRPASESEPPTTGPDQPD
jgi:general secretion pathway protein G